jgi:hypothetical protein
MAPKGFSTPSGINIVSDSDKERAEEYFRSVIQTLTKWMEDQYDAPSSKDILSCILSSSGRIVYDIISSMAGRKVTGVVSTASMGILS